ncbi:High-affinity choline transporter 1 [Caenorhabditis elegans]|uniref:High-affinity choline transporter 1 n=1 Tax=Caenorhabditis elegans TaxID=6239 RepID=SC5A7_CAEEL|nr:High-affinity choline transporter 1 [Caenorhabditis elegans]O02228.2 RecName: Full=High-affinity choline transporter 1 [Caenorhabditis elegans]BAA90483.1 high-affinity choline transporter CHO-1 [Caenorhabditis elegans]CAB02847.2 High-affinity choline transporter 1 [Caenorhabditis elegans]|eukprot:NP_502539.1 High-affinity choline transporter 1 [Caenorhabditis elegans]
MADLLGIVAIVFFYVLILVVGIWAGRKSKSSKELESEAGAATEEVMLAGRNIGTLVGIFTMTATWVGGAYINGTAEALYNGGLLGCQAPVGYAISLVMGGLLFAKKMREEGYITMLDPFQHKYGQRIGGLMYVPALLGETFWTAAILSALGATLSVILGIDMNASVTLSACIAVFYTFTGGYYAVAYTDVVQLFCIFVGLWVCVPAAMVHDGAKDISRNAGDWIGEIGGFKETSLWIDCMLLLVFGGIPWQVYFQRVLSSKTAHGAQTLSFVAGVGCILMAIPPALIGAIARNTDWRMTDYSPWNNGTKVESIPPDKRNMVVPLVFQYLTPRWVAFIGLGAVSAAVMSSADSSVLSAASMFAHNIWKLTIRPHASEKEVIIVMRIAIICVGIMATIMALTIQSIYGLWYLCADLVYVILFPQLLCVVYMPRSNTYGSLAGYAVGLVLRLIGGEPLVSLPAFFHYPMYTDGVQYFPFRTTAMLSSMATIYIVSIQSEKLFKSGRLSPEWDVMGCVVNIPIDHVPLPSDVSFAVSSETLNMKAPNGTPAPVHPNQQPSDENTLLHPYSDQSYYSTNSN